MFDRRAALPTLILLLSFPAGRLAADDFATVESRLRGDVLSSTSNATVVNGYVASLSATGRWSDINYADRNITSWSPAAHLERLLEMTKAYVAPGHSLRGSASLRAAIDRALDGWFAADPRSDNWWANEINAPRLMGRTLLLMHDQLDAGRLASGLTIVARAYRPRSTVTGTNTGANRIDRAYATLLRGVILRDRPLTGESFLAVGDTLAPTTAEGIQIDGSFHQHGPQPQNGSYGRVFVETAAAVAGYGAGTSFALPAGQSAALVDFLLDGQQWFIRGRTFDFTMMGRSISRPGSRNLGSSMIEPVASALALTGHRRDELLAFQARLDNAKTIGIANPALALVGNRHFWRSDVTVHHRADYSTSVKVSSTRTFEPEMANGEGLKSLHLADGVNLILRRGDEYADIFPVWDWRRLPGTTTEQGTYSLAPAGTSGVRGTSTFAGGVSDGHYGATVFDYGRRNVAARKSWFFFDQEFVALGAGIDAPQAAHPVITTVNQVLRRSTVFYGNEAAVLGGLTSGTVTRSDIGWVHHDGIGYVFPSGAGSVTLRAARQSGAWSSINTSRSSEVLTSDVFSLQFDHGTRPAAADYAYIVLPGADANATRNYASTSRLRVLANRRDLQAVTHDGLGLTQAAFYAPGSLAIGGGLGLTVRSPAAVMLADTGGQLRLSAANPAGLAADLRIDLARDLPDNQGDFARMTLRLPGGELGGATVTRTLERPARPTFVATFREAATDLDGLLHHWTFEGDTAADRLAAAVGGVDLVPRAYGTAASTQGIVYGPGLDAGSVAMSPLRLGRTADSAGGAALVTTRDIIFPDAFTIEALVRPDLLERGGTTGFAVMAGGWRTGNRGYFLAQREAADTDSLAAIIGDSLTQSDNVAGLVEALVPGRWYYVASTYQVTGAGTLIRSHVADLTGGDATARLAIDGQLASGRPPTSGPMGIGGLFHDGLLQEAWSGSIDEVAVYGRRLSDEEIQARVASLYAPPERLVWGGADSWSSTAPTWWHGGSRLGWSPDSMAVFAGPGQGVTIDGTVAVRRGLRFEADGFTLLDGGLRLASDGVTIDVAAATTVAGTVLSGTQGFRKQGPGELVLTVANPLSGSVTVDQGLLMIAHPGALASGTVQVAAGASLAVAEPLAHVRLAAVGDLHGVFDIGSARVELAPAATSPSDHLHAALRAGRGDGSWQGTFGITSRHAVALGVDHGFAVGFTVDPTDHAAVIRWASVGDADLDGSVTTADLNAILTSGLLNTGRDGAAWFQGDFDYDGRVTTADLNALLTTGRLNGGPYGGMPAAVAAVPEPPTPGLAAGLAAAAMLRRRRRRSP